MLSVKVVEEWESEEERTKAQPCLVKERGKSERKRRVNDDGERDEKKDSRHGRELAIFVLGRPGVTAADEGEAHRKQRHTVGNDMDGPGTSTHALHDGTRDTSAKSPIVKQAMDGRIKPACGSGTHRL